PRAPRVAAVASAMASAKPEKKSAKSCSKAGMSMVRFTMLARSVARTVSRSPSPTTESARNESMFSASETRSPLRRSRFENSRSFSFMGYPVARGELVEDVLVALEARGLELRPLQLDVLLELRSEERRVGKECASW